MITPGSNFIMFTLAPVVVFSPEWTTEYWTQYSCLAFDENDGVTPIAIGNSGNPCYMQLVLGVNGSWNIGYRPTSVTITLTYPDGTIPNYGSGQLNIGGLSIPAIWQSGDNTFDLTGMP